MPRTITIGGINIDVDRNVNVVYSPKQDKEREKAFMILSGLSSSVSENRILEAFFNIPSVSAVRLLKLASEQGVPVYAITNLNLNDILPQLQVDTDTNLDIINAVNAGKTVIVSKTNITFGQWTGAGYIVIDPVTGAASYMISRSLGGGDMDQTPIADPNFKATWFDKMIFDIVRLNIISCGQNLVGTLYREGCKDPSVTGACRGRIDCSGLTTLCYEKAGITLLKFKNGDYRNAQQQYDYSLITEEPKYGDLVFFQGTNDKTPCDGLKNPDDGITHVTIYVRPNMMIGAGGRGVRITSITGMQERYEQWCEESACVKKENGVCIEFDRCNCAVKWQDNKDKDKFTSFVGYGKIIP